MRSKRQRKHGPYMARTDEDLRAIEAITRRIANPPKLTRPRLRFDLLEAPESARAVARDRRSGALRDAAAYPIKQIIEDRYG